MDDGIVTGIVLGVLTAVFLAAVLLCVRRGVDWNFARKHLDEDVQLARKTRNTFLLSVTIAVIMAVAYVIALYLML